MVIFQYFLGVYCRKKSGVRVLVIDKEKFFLEKQEMFFEGEICIWFLFLKNVNLGKYKKV